MRKIAAVMLTVALALSLALSPTRAYAFGGTYVGNCTTKEETAAQYLGYSYYELSSEVRGLLSGAGYSAWQRWESSLWVYGTLEHPSFREGWGTDYEGAELVSVTDAARNDIERAMRAAASSGGTSGGGSGTGTGGGTSGETGNHYLTLTPFTGVKSGKNSEAYCLKKGDTYTYPRIAVNDLAVPLAKSYAVRFTAAAWDKLMSYARAYGRVLVYTTSYSTYYDQIDIGWYCWPSSIEVTPYYVTMKRGDVEYKGLAGYKANNTSGSTFYYMTGSGSTHLTRANRAKAPSDESGLADFFDVISKTEVTENNYASEAVIGGGEYAWVYADGTTGHDVGYDPPSGGGGDTTNVYEGDTNNYTNNVTNTTTNSNTTVTTYDETTNTYNTTNNYVTETNIDMSAITKRLDAINAKLGQLGRDLAQVEQWLDEDWSAALDTMRGWWNRLFSWLNVIDGDIRALQTDTGGGTSGGGSGDLSGIEQQLEDVKGKLDALLVAATIDAAANVAQAIMELINGLLSKFGDALGVLKDAMGELSSVFPFSLPWDLAALAALFAADPVTPVFDLAVPDFGQIHSATSIHVDLHDWDDVAAVVRSGELVLFATDLILRTREMMGAGSDDIC